MMRGLWIHIGFAALSLFALAAAVGWWLGNGTPPSTEQASESPAVVANIAEPTWSASDLDVELWHVLPPPPPPDPPPPPAPSPEPVPQYTLLGIRVVDGVHEAILLNASSNEVFRARSGGVIGIEAVELVDAQSVVLTRAHGGRRTLRLDVDAAP